MRKTKESSSLVATLVEEQNVISNQGEISVMESNSASNSGVSIRNPKMGVAEILNEEARTKISREKETDIKAHTAGNEYLEFDYRVMSQTNVVHGDFLKAVEVDIKLVDKLQLIRRKKSTESVSSGYKKNKKSAFPADDLKPSEKKCKQRKLSEPLCRNRSDSIYEENCKAANVGYSGPLPETNGFCLNLKQDQWAAQPIKQEDIGFSDNALNEKLPINLSLKYDEGKSLPLTSGDEVHSDTRGPNTLTSDTAKNHAMPLTTSESNQSSKMQPDSGKHFPNAKLSESLELSKVSEKSCKDDLNGSENDMIREDPVCIYCYKKLPKDISHIIEHCRLCVYMLRPINIKYMCYMCLYNTHCRTGIKRHIMRHLNIRPYTCSICPFSGIVSRSLKLHMKTHSMEQLMNLSDEKKSQQVNLHNSESSEYTDDTFDNEQTLSSVGASESSFTGTKTCENTSGHFEKSLEDRTSSDPLVGLSDRLMDPILLTNAHKMDPSVGLLSELLIQPMRAHASDMEQDNVHNDSNNNVNSGASHLYDKIDAQRILNNTSDANAIDLRNNYQSILDAEVATFHNLNKASYSMYGNNADCNSFEMSLKTNSFADYLMLAGPERVDNGALDYCLKKST